MEAIGIHLASKAQRFTRSRWFIRQKAAPEHIQSGRENSQNEAAPQEYVHTGVHGSHERWSRSSDQMKIDHLADETASRVAHHNTPSIPKDNEESMTQQQAEKPVLATEETPDCHHPEFENEDVQGEHMLVDHVNVDDRPLASPQDDCLSESPQPGEEVVMDGLGAEHFTKTSARIVTGHDGTNVCPVLLLTFDLSNKIQEMIQFQRTVLKQEREAQAKLRAIADFKPILSREIMNHKARIARIAESSGGYRSPDGGRESDVLEKLGGELGNLEMLELDVKAREEILESNVARKLSYLREHWADVNAYLEEAFVVSEAIEPAREEVDEPAPDLDLQEEYQNLVDQMQEFEGGSQAGSPLETGDAFMTDVGPPPTPELQAHIAASEALEDARDGLRYAQEQFDRKGENRKRELSQNMDAVLRGETVAENEEDFELRWVLRNRQLTRELLEAEEAVSHAKLAAQGVGLQIDWGTQSSCFADDKADGSPELASHEPVDRKCLASDPRMIAWQESLADTVDPELWDGTTVEVDAWGTEEEVDFEDSPSCVAGGTLRVRIDKWEGMRPRRASIV